MFALLSLESSKKPTCHILCSLERLPVSHKPVMLNYADEAGEAVDDQERSD